MHVGRLSQPKNLSDFGFSADEVPEGPALRERIQQIEYVGSATSHFQADPLLYDEDGQPRVSSDWEFELTRRLQGRDSGIPHADINSLPKFLERKRDYISRSAQLSENMFRFSIDFARLCPREDQFDAKLMTEYLKALALIRIGGQEPFLTVHHFTMPKWLCQTDRDGNFVRGGWENRNVTRHFRFYIENVVRYLADKDRIRAILQELRVNSDLQVSILSQGLCRYFMTLNEPAVLIPNGYFTGTFPPYQLGNLLAARRVLNNLVEAHNIGLGVLKDGLGTQTNGPRVCVGHNWQFFLGLLGMVGQEYQEYCTYRFERDGNNSDFLGLQYYFRWKARLTSSQRRQLDFGDQPQFGDVYPPGVLEVIRRMHAAYPRKSIFVTEFGFSDKLDLRRPFWILETARYIMIAARDGIPIMGMLLWAMVDNFEWHLGMSQSFGLFKECELSNPLVPSQVGIRSWEAWRAVNRLVAAPSSENLETAQHCHETAYAQYKEAGGKY